MSIVGCCSGCILCVRCSGSSDFDSSVLHRVVACVAFQLVNARTIVWWGFCFGCFFDYVGQCIVASECYFYSGFFLSRLVTFLICGDKNVNVAHFSFLVGSVG